MSWRDVELFAVMSGDVNPAYVDEEHTRGDRALRDVRADDLAAIPLLALVERNPEIDFSETTT